MRLDPRSVATSADCEGRSLVSFTAREADATTLTLTLAPLRDDGALTCGRRAEISTPGLRATHAEMYSVGPMERDGVRCRTFIGGANFVTASGEEEEAAQVRFHIHVPESVVSGVPDRYEVKRASLLGVVQRSGASCSYDLLLPQADGEYRSRFDGSCDSTLSEIDMKAFDTQSPVRSALEPERYGTRGARGHALSDVAAASTTLAASATDRPSECTTIFGFSAPFLPFTEEDSSIEHGSPVELLRLSRCEGPLRAIRRAIEGAEPFDPSG